MSSKLVITFQFEKSLLFFHRGYKLRSPIYSENFHKGIKKSTKIIKDSLKILIEMTSLLRHLDLSQICPDMDHYCHQNCQLHWSSEIKIPVVLQDGEKMIENRDKIISRNKKKHDIANLNRFA